LRTTLPELAARIAHLYAAHRVVDEPAVLDFDVRLDPPRPWRRAIAAQVAPWIDGRRRFAPFPRAQALPMLEWVLNWCVFSRPHQYLILHSAVLERRGLAVVLSGHPGAGKSTLCAALALRGFRLFSDEVALIRPDSLDIVPVPRPVSLKEESIGVVRRFDPGADVAHDCDDTRKGTVAYLAPPADSVRRGDQTARPGLLIFPHWSAGAALDLRPVPKAMALLRTARQSFNYSVLGETGFETLAEFVERSSCLDLLYGDLHDAVPAIAAAVEAHAP